MNLKKFLNQLNIIEQCRKYGIPLWQCPQFLFLIMGAFIAVVLIISYGLASEYIREPQGATLVSLFLATILLAIAFVISQSFERLAEASRMKSEFVSIVSHQLRAPLTSLKWALDAMLSGDSGEISEKVMKYLNILKENGERMNELIENLLVVARLEQKKALLEKKEISLEDLTKKLIEEYAPFAKSSNIEIIFDSQKSLPPVFIDASYIKIVIEALLNNAIRYTQGKGDKIEIQLRADEKRFHFKIKDNGIGISSEEQKYIFQKFFRSINAQKHQSTGSGLGLYIVKMLIEKSGGKVGFESEEDKGSMFWFEIPLGHK